jgi:DNA-binding NarL/FixJ family response regulator
MRQSRLAAFSGWGVVAGPACRPVAVIDSPAAAFVGGAVDTQSAVRAAVAAERARIVRQMEDAVSNTLLGVSMIAASLASAPRLADPQTLNQQLRELARLASRAVAEARDVIKDERHEAPPPLAGPEPASSLRADDHQAGCHPGSLRPREREIMGLIADGLSNRQIAARLVISDKTVKNHICSIYQRLGIKERGEAISRWRAL